MPSIYNAHCEKNEMVLDRTYQLPQRRPIDIACHHFETIWQEKTTRETSQTMEKQPGQILERHDMAEDSTRQGHLETACWGLRPTTGHNSCLMMMMMVVFWTCATWYWIVKAMLYNNDRLTHKGFAVPQIRGMGLFVECNHLYNTT